MRRAPKILIAIGLLVGLAPLAVAIVADPPDDRPEVPSPLRADPSPAGVDRTEELRACRDRGAAALDHPPCLRLWSEQRDRFLGVADEESRTETDSPIHLTDRPDDPRPPTGQD